MVRYLPESSPAFWHQTDGRAYSLTDSLLWRNLWTLTGLHVMAAQLGGDKSAAMPAKTMPKFPWSPIESSGGLFSGDLGAHTPEEALDYLDNL